MMALGGCYPVLAIFAILVAANSSLDLLGLAGPVEKGWIDPGDVDIFIGDLFNVTCTIDKDIINGSSDTMYFTKRYPVNGTFRQKKMDSAYWRIVNSTTITLRYRPETRGLDEGLYKCYISVSGKDDYVEAVYVKLYDRPSVPNNISCKVDNWVNLTCSWKLTSDPEMTRVNVSWTVDNIPISYSKTAQSLSSYTWLPGNFHMGRVYNIVITVETKTLRNKTLASIQSEMVTVNTSQLVKPAPVTDMQVMDLGSTCVRLSWQQESNHSLDCRVQYKCTQWQTRCQVQELELVQNNSATICSLVAWTQYTFTVSCRPSQGGYWSVATSGRHRTAIDVPARPPEVHPGSYTDVACRTSDLNCRGIKIYWMPLPPRLAHGPISAYRVSCSDDSSYHNTTVVSANTMSHDLELRQQFTYNVWIQACTSAGCTELSDPIIVPPAVQGVASPQGFVSELFLNQTTDGLPLLCLSWEGGDISLETYTIYWCRGIKRLHVCQFPISWSSVSSNNSHYNLTIPGLSRHNYDRYLVGISAERFISPNSNRNLTLLPPRKPRATSSILTSSGISWSVCNYIAGRAPSKALEYQAWYSSDTDSIVVAWSRLTCLDTPSVVTSYVITYCIVDNVNQCSGEEEETTTDGGKTNHTLIGLPPRNKFRITVHARSGTKDGPLGPPLIVELPGPLPVHMIIILVTVGGLVFVLLLAIFIYCCQSYVKKKTSKYDVNYPEQFQQLTQHVDNGDEQVPQDQQVNQDKQVQQNNQQVKQQVKQVPQDNQVQQVKHGQQERHVQRVKPAGNSIFRKPQQKDEIEILLQPDCSRESRHGWGTLKRVNSDVAKPSPVVNRVPFQTDQTNGDPLEQFKSAHELQDLARPSSQVDSEDPFRERLRSFSKYCPTKVHGFMKDIDIDNPSDSNCDATDTSKDSKEGSSIEFVNEVLDYLDRNIDDNGNKRGDQMAGAAHQMITGSENSPVWTSQQTPDLVTNPGISNSGTLMFLPDPPASPMITQVQEQSPGPDSGMGIQSPVADADSPGHMVIANPPRTLAPKHSPGQDSGMGNAEPQTPNDSDSAVNGLQVPNAPSCQRSISSDSGTGFELNLSDMISVLDGDGKVDSRATEVIKSLAKRDSLHVPEDLGIQQNHGRDSHGDLLGQKQCDLSDVEMRPKKPPPQRHTSLNQKRPAPPPIAPKSKSLILPSNTSQVKDSANGYSHDTTSSGVSPYVTHSSVYHWS